MLDTTVITNKNSQGDYFKRLIFYKRGADQSYWDSCWKQLKVEGYLGDRFLINLIQNQIPHKGELLENGCGLGQEVKTLSDMGYSIQGVDFSKLALVKAKTFHPELCLIAGDVISLPYRDDAFSCCLSFGVVEHFKDGPKLPLKEIYRTLAVNGMLVISVPYFNPIRQVKVIFSQNNESIQKEFYQYAFTPSEFKSILQENGFKVLSVFKFDAFDGIKDDIPMVNQFLRRVRSQTSSYKTSVNPQTTTFSRLISTVLNSKLVRNISGHMMVVIAQKTN
jgi:SAM-dependent methyltransferase